MMAALYDVSIPAINQHIKTIFNDGELAPDSVIMLVFLLALYCPVSNFHPNLVGLQCYMFEM